VYKIAASAAQLANCILLHAYLHTAAGLLSFMLLEHKQKHQEHFGSTTHLLENTFDGKRISANSSPNLNPTLIQTLTLKHNHIFNLTKWVSFRASVQISSIFYYKLMTV